jgi:FMN phosphatase YigB (HAD superfamily)/DNA-binding Xre family transcriptional regulator
MAMTAGGEVTDELALGKQLQAARRAGGFTQQQLCQRAGISYSTLTKIERGAIKAPSIFTIQGIASALDISLDELLGHPTLGGLSSQAEKKVSQTGVRFVYFDLNDCLVQPRSKGFALLAEESGQPIDVVESVFWRYDGPVCRGEISMDELNTVWAERLGIMVDWRRYYLQGVEKMPGVEEFVAWVASHYHVGILSNSMPGFIPAMKQQGMLPSTHFDQIIDSSEVHALKPEPEIFRIATERAGVQPHEILLIDDNRANLMAAEDAGWRAIQFDSYQPDTSIESIKTALQPAA